MWAVRQLFNPISYLRIRQGSGLFTSKLTYDWVIPLVLTVVVVLAIFKTNPDIHLLRDGGLFERFARLLELLIAFFIAALAAVATFSREGLDTEMKGEPALLAGVDAQGKTKDYPLTRRQFVCYLFGYLSFMALAIYIVISFSAFMGIEALALKTEWIKDTYQYIKWPIIFVFFFFIWQLIVTMLLGIYFLSERLQVMDDPNR